jgi:hypothetical protein
MHVPAKLVRKQSFVTDRGSGRRAAAWFRSVMMYAARETIGDRGTGRSRELYPAQPAETVQCSACARVRDSRVAFQAATREEFIAAVEAITDRKVTAFASAVDPETAVVFESFSFEPRGFESEHPHLHEVEARP